MLNVTTAEAAKTSSRKAKTEPVLPEGHANEKQTGNNSGTVAQNLAGANLGGDGKVSPLAKGVPLPPAQAGGGKAKYPWADMEVGDAFFTEGAKIETFYTLTNSANKKYGRKFAARKIADGGIFGPEFSGKPGVGVWRVE